MVRPLRRRRHCLSLLVTARHCSSLPATARHRPPIAIILEPPLESVYEGNLFILASQTGLGRSDRISRYRLPQTSLPSSDFQASPAQISKPPSSDFQLLSSDFRLPQLRFPAPPAQIFSSRSSDIQLRQPPCSSVQPSSAQRSPAQLSSAQLSPAQRSSAQLSPDQPSLPDFLKIILRFFLFSIF